MKIKIEVTEKDIEKAKKFLKTGKIGIANNCPVALALKRATNNQSLWVCCDSYCPAPATLIRLPKKVSDFIEKFDALLPVKPFSFFISPKEQN